VVLIEAEGRNWAEYQRKAVGRVRRRREEIKEDTGKVSMR
jgi:hypothetical protein